MNDAPNLPGIRRNLATAYPKMYRDYQSSLRSNNLLEEDEQSVNSVLESSASLAEMSHGLSLYPATTKSHSDLTARYSLKSQQSDRLSSQHLLPFKSLEHIPNFIINDNPLGKICRFYGYFCETTGDIQAKPTRTRKVEFYYYLDDNTIEINEPSVKNSGAIQGKLLKRHQIPKKNDKNFLPAISSPNKSPRSPQKNTINNNKDKLLINYKPIEFIAINDFYSGAKLWIYNRCYYITDCDIATKKYYEVILKRSFGSIINDYPLIDYDTCYANLSPNLIEQRSKTAALNAILNPNRKSITQNIPKFSSYNSMCTPESLAFFEYDKKVLRFYGVWDNRNQLYGDKINVRIHYSLADNTFEVIPIHELNSGRSYLATILNKTKLLKKTVTDDDDQSVSTSIASTTSLEHNLNEQSYYHWSDLYIGLRIIIAAVDVILIDADQFTRDFYDQKGFSLAPAINHDDNPLHNYSNTLSLVNINHTIDEDEYTIPDLKSMIPTHPVKDGAKLKHLQGIILRYNALFKSPKPCDNKRKFLIFYHLEDDTLEIREPPERNSGHIGGHFITRRKVENELTKKYFQPKDFYVGNEIYVLSTIFMITSADEPTLYYMEHNFNLWINSNINNVMNKIKYNNNDNIIISLILTTKSLNTCYYSYYDIKRLIFDHIIVSNNEIDSKLNEQEIITLCRNLDPTRTKFVKLTKLLKFITDYGKNE